MRGADIAALVAAYGAVSVGSWRAAAWAGVNGSLRLLVAVVIGASTIVVESLVLGVADLGASRAALVAAAVGFAVVTHVLAPTPSTGVAHDLAGWWGSPRSSVIATTATIGAASATLVWVWWRPFVGFDGMLQNLVQINGWIHSGRPGSQRRVLTVAPVEAFPMTNDVMLGWHAALTRTFASTSLWSVGAAVVFVAALSVLLRDLGVAAPTRWLAIASVVTVPHFVGQLNSPKTDVAALAWLATGAALAWAAQRHPRLLVFALVAGGLSIGAKTTTMPLVGLLVIVALWRLRPPVVRVAAGVVGATAVGGIWYLRNLVDHGSPLWPFTATPWGDPVAPIFAVPSSRFVADPVETLRTQFGDWTMVAAGGLVLVSLALVIAAVWGGRRVRWIVGAALVTLALWTVAPVTGPDNAPLAGDVLTSTTRYLLPTMVLGAIALALVASERPGTRRWCQLLFGSIVIANAVALAAEESDVIPSLVVVAAGAALGAAIGWGAGSGGSRTSAALVATPAIVIVAMGLGVGLAADGWTDRHRASLEFGKAPIDEMLASERYRGGDETVAATNLIWSDLAGDELRHDVILLPAGLDCAAYDDLRADAWLVLGDRSFVGAPDVPLQRGCLADVEPFAVEPGLVVLAPGDP